MTLRMADGPVASLPQGFDAYAGYVNDSGIGETWREVQAAFPSAHHLSISTNGAAAMCADVEWGAMSSWSGFDYGYCNISQAQALINRDGRPKKLWIAHYNPVFGAHICSPTCGFGFTGYADGTQWTDHSGVWDESLLLDDFFPLHFPPNKPKRVKMFLVSCNGVQWLIGANNSRIQVMDASEPIAAAIGATQVFPVSESQLAQWPVKT